jgi:multimeric flavodoxin WrbA
VGNVYVLGISGSPVPDANTDRLVKTILNATRAEDQEFIKLSEVNIGPCRGHMKCVENNRCDVNDDWSDLGRRILRADALVIGTPTYYSSPSAFTKCLIERCYSFRHQRLLLKGKLCAVVAMGSATESIVADWTSKILASEGMEVVGSMAVKGTMFCLNCGHGNDCPYPAWNTFSKELTGIDHGIKEAYTKYLEVLPDNVPYEKGSAVVRSNYRDVRTEPEIVKKAESLGRRLRSRHDEKNGGLTRI